MSFIPSVMDGGAYGSSIPSPPTESLSSHSTVDLVTDSPSDAVPLFPQGPFFEDEGPQTNSWLLDIPLTLLNPQVSKEASLNASCGRGTRPSFQLTRIFSNVPLDFIHRSCLLPHRASMNELGHRHRIPKARYMKRTFLSSVRVVQTPRAGQQLPLGSPRYKSPLDLLEHTE